MQAVVCHCTSVTRHGQTGSNVTVAHITFVYRDRLDNYASLLLKVQDETYSHPL